MSFEHLQNALSLLHQAGNSRILNEKNAKDYGVSELYVKAYLKNMKNLYSAACAYEQAIYAIPVDNAAVAEAVGPLRTAWAKLLECSTDTIVKIKPNEYDLWAIATYATKFVSSAVNFDLKEKWSCAKAPTDATPAGFQKLVETYIGIRVDETRRMTPELRDYTEDANRIVSNIRSNERKLKELNSEISGLEAAKEAEAELAVKAYIDRTLAKKREERTKLEESIVSLKSDLSEIRAMTPETYLAKKAEEEKAEVERRRNQRKERRQAKRLEANAGNSDTKESEPATEPATKETETK